MGSALRAEELANATTIVLQHDSQDTNISCHMVEDNTDLTDTEGTGGSNSRESLDAGGEGRTGNCKHGELHGSMGRVDEEEALEQEL